jgi:hypothetical protein
MKSSVLLRFTRKLSELYPSNNVFLIWIASLSNLPTEKCSILFEILLRNPENRKASQMLNGLIVAEKGVLIEYKIFAFKLYSHEYFHISEILKKQGWTYLDNEANKKEFVLHEPYPWRKIFELTMMIGFVLLFISSGALTIFIPLLIPLLYFFVRSKVTYCNFIFNRPVQNVTQRKAKKKLYFGLTKTEILILILAAIIFTTVVTLMVWFIFIKTP